LQADEGYLIGPPPAAQSYLRQDAILDVAHRSGSHVPPLSLPRPSERPSLISLARLAV